MINYASRPGRVQCTVKIRQNLTQAITEAFAIIMPHPWTAHDGVCHRFFLRGLLASLLMIGFAFSASAQDRQPGPARPRAASPAEAPPTLTGKERLGGKWTDEQRIDNCNVPIDKRGTKPRPSTCARASTGS
jgi:hypothetical protein